MRKQLRNFLLTFLFVPIFLCGQENSFKNFAPTPPMGWNSWNAFQENVSEEKILKVVDDFIGKGLKDAGYQYICIDDGWASGRDGDGTIIVNPKKFPHGMKYIANYIHGKGLKFGIYTAPGATTCAQCTRSYGYEQKDVETYASWGVDYIKLDYCGAKETSEVIAKKWRAALDQVQRPIVLSVNMGTIEITSNYVNLWRTTTDLFPAWDLPMSEIINWKPVTITTGIDLQSGLDNLQSSGGYNDPDMLQVGNGALSYDENKAHFGMWAIFGAPLILGNNISTMSDEVREIITNKELIAIDQDPLCYHGRKVYDSGTGRSKFDKHYGQQVWVKKCSKEGEFAVGLLNRSEFTNAMSISFSDIGLDSMNVFVRDLWTHQDKGRFNGKYFTEVPSHGIAVIKIKGKIIGEIKDASPVLKDSVTVEAENETLYRAIKANFYNGYSGYGYAQFCGEPPNQYIRFVVNIPEDGTYEAGIRYSNLTRSAGYILLVSGSQTVQLTCQVPDGTKITSKNEEWLNFEEKIPVPKGTIIVSDHIESVTWDYAYTKMELKKGLNVIKVISKEVLTPLIDQLIIKKR